MIGPLLMTTVLLLMLFGREVLRARPGRVEIWLGLPLLGVAAVYDVSRMRNLRPETPPPKSGQSWRGDHAVFDYGANEVRFGSALDAAEVAELGRAIETASRSAIRRGDARPEDIAGAWEASALLATPLPLPGEQAQRVAPLPPPSLTSTSSIVLILANLVPVAGAAFFGWELSDVMVLYWAESAIIGFFNLCKMAVIGRWSALLAGPFFLGHFGGFMAVHFLFIYGIFVEGMENTGSGGDLREVAQLFYRLWPALLALFLSHGYSFVVNFLGRQEYRGRRVQDQMSEPYSRIVFMHLVLIFGGFLTMALGGPTPVLVAVIVLKVAIDLRSHLKERSRSAGAGGGGVPGASG